MVMIRRVLAAIDLFDLSPAVVGYAGSQAMAWQAHLLVVHVVHDLLYCMGVSVSDTPPPELQQRLEIEAQERLQTLCQATLCHQMAYEALVRTGRPVVEIHRLMRERGVDCVVIGAHSTDKPGNQLFGSTADRLLHQSPCPILVVPPRRVSNFVSYR
jgi:universal stress protein A